jgi:ribonuclease III
MISLTENTSQKELQKFTGYKFRDEEILEGALTRRAYHKENPSKNENYMDPLATLGDAVLDAVVVYRLYEEGNRKKGALTIEKIRKVNRGNIQIFAEKHRLQDYIQWGKGEKKDKIWAKGKKALDTAFEALIGAVFLDAQRHEKSGIKAVEELLKRLGYFK